MPIGSTSRNRLARRLKQEGVGDVHDASAFVRTIEQRQGQKIMCLEEIGLELGYLTPDQVRARADKLRFVVVSWFAEAEEPG